MSSARPIRFGICGLGAMGRTHFARVAQTPGAALVAVCDRDADRRRGEWHDAVGNLDAIRGSSGRAAWSSIARYATVAELCADPQVDAVIIALPTCLHADATVTALQAGKHVLCEKPMAVRVGECDRMIDAAAASGRMLMVAQCIRFWPQYVAVRELIGAGRIGAVRCALLRRVGSLPTYSADHWMLDPAQSGGAILDLHVHDIDFAHHLLGVPESITACGHRGTHGGIDHVAATWSYASGVYAQIEGGWLHDGVPFEMAVTVVGESGTLHWSSRGESAVNLYSAAGTESRACAGDAYAAEVAYFVHAVQAGQRPDLCLPASTRTSIVLAWLERRAIESRRPIPVNERLRAAWGG